MDEFCVSIILDPRKPFTSATRQVVAMIIDSRPKAKPEDTISSLPVTERLKLHLLELYETHRLGPPARRLPKEETPQAPAPTPAPSPPIKLELVPPPTPAPKAEAPTSPFLREDGSLMTVDEVHEAHLRLALEKCGGNVVATASALAVGRATVYRWMKRFNIPLTDLNERPLRGRHKKK